MIAVPFLTDLDSRATIKGSRDPLGIQSIWTRFGRHVVGNLSTVSNSARDFTILILGYHFAEQVAETAGPGITQAEQEVESTHWRRGQIGQAIRREVTNL